MDGAQNPDVRGADTPATVLMDLVMLSIAMAGSVVDTGHAEVD